MSHVARQVRITGRVQGVFFRAWAAQEAQALEITGWVRNAPDGSVEAHLEGDQWAVQRLVELLHQGPPSAQVAQVDVKDARFERADRFEIQH